MPFSASLAGSFSFKVLVANHQFDPLQTTATQPLEKADQTGLVLTASEGLSNIFYPSYGYSGKVRFNKGGSDIRAKSNGGQAQYMENVKNDGRSPILAQIRLQLYMAGYKIQETGILGGYRMNASACVLTRAA